MTQPPRLQDVPASTTAELAGVLGVPSQFQSDRFNYRLFARLVMDLVSLPRLSADMFVRMHDGSCLRAEAQVRRRAGETLVRFGGLHCKADGVRT
jgi:hypothetical protein